MARCRFPQRQNLNQSGIFRSSTSEAVCPLGPLHVPPPRKKRRTYMTKAAPCPVPTKEEVLVSNHLSFFFFLLVTPLPPSAPLGPSVGRIPPQAARGAPTPLSLRIPSAGPRFAQNYARPVVGAGGTGARHWDGDVSSGPAPHAAGPANVLGRFLSVGLREGCGGGAGARCSAAVSAVTPRRLSARVPRRPRFLSPVRALRAFARPLSPFARPFVSCKISMKEIAF